MSRPPDAGCDVRLYPCFGVRWRLRNEAHAQDVEAATRYLVQPDLSPELQILKRSERRLVFVLPESETGSELVVKAFPVSDLKRRFFNGKYAKSEAGNLAEPARRGVNVPELLAWGTGTLRLQPWTAVLMRRIVGVPFDQVLQTQKIDREEAIQRCVTVLMSLFSSGVNHIDLRPDVIFLGPAGDAVIDFQYCRFLPSPVLVTFIAQLGYFLHWWKRQDRTPQAMDDQSLWLNCAATVLAEHRDVAAGPSEIVEAIRAASETTQSIKARLAQ